MSKVLRRGYTTGAHTYMIFNSALDYFLSTNLLSISKTNKMDNDDLDVTKNCELVLTISNNLEDLSLNQTPHKPQVCINETNKLSIYAGLGVGVVTKKGLKIPPDFPAINPTPLNAMFEIFTKLTKNHKNLDLKCSVSITDGETISKQTANAKVGVLGGLSILGTTGIVKPVSSSAYIDSVQTEIEFAKQNEYNPLIFTIGNTTFNTAKERYEEAQIVEVANFVYDSIEISTNLDIKKVVLVCGIGKMTKVYQGFKNTHNRFGSIDFVQLKIDIKNEIGYEVDIESTKTVKGLSIELESVGLVEELYTMIAKKANEQIKEWFPTSNVEARILEQNEVIKW
ncbi:cobalt-precorrin-5B (C(1))-methyltransferase CbiD [Arcobacteraceae bacterium]|nr:cobalt-precorrin-5B (C(1))-methyltransferase CbiD [Arcobacteraceae bacterium]